MPWSVTPFFFPDGSDPAQVTGHADLVEDALAFSDDLVKMSLSLATNYDSFYLNPDLEALLNTRGFSTKRPEILGMFNYVAPLSASPEKEGLFVINPSGELYDFQCQLKQLRYSDTLDFLTNQIGLTVSGGLLAASPTGNARVDEIRDTLISQYEVDMLTAGRVLHYLATIYNAVSGFIDAQDLNYNFNTFEKNSTSVSWATTSSDKVFGVTPTVLNDGTVALPLWFREDEVSLNTVLFETLGRLDYSALSYGTADLEEFSDHQGSDYYGDDSPTSIVSGTWSMLAGMNLIMGALYGLSATPGIVNNSFDTDFDPASDDFGKKLPGYKSFTMKIPKIFDTALDTYGFFLEPASLGMRAVWLTSNGSYVDESKYEELGLFEPEEDQYFGGTSSSHESQLGGAATLAYLAGLDTIQGQRMYEVNTISGFGFSATQVDTDRISEFIEKNAGRDISETKSTVLTDLPDQKKTFTRKILTENLDDDNDDRSAIESFTQTNFLLANGVENSRSGRSYYCDEVVTNEIGETKNRINKLNEGLTALGEQLKGYSSLIFSRRPAGKSWAKNYKSYGYENNSFVAPGDIVTHVVAEIQRSYEDCVARKSDFKEDITGSHLLNYLAAAASIENVNIDYLISVLNIAYYKWKKDPSDENLEDLNVAGRTLQDSVLDICCDTIIERDNTMDVGYGTWALFESTARLGGGDDPRETQIYDHVTTTANTNPSGTSTDYRYFPQAVGMHVSVPHGDQGSFEQALKDYDEDSTTGRQYLKAALTDGDPVVNWDFETNILLAPYRALLKYEQVIEGAGTDGHTRLTGYTSRGLDVANKILAVKQVWKEFIRRSLTCGLYVQNTTSSNEYAQSSITGLKSTDYNLGSHIWSALYVVNFRAMYSFIDFAKLFTTNSQGNLSSFNPYTLLKEEGTTGGGVVEPGDIEELGYHDDSRDYDGYGYYQTIEDLHWAYTTIMRSCLSRDLYALRALQCVAQASDRLSGAATNLLGAIEDNDVYRGLYDEALEEIKSDPNFQNAALLSITRDQLSLNQALFDSFQMPNRDYPYLPASKAIMVNQTKNLSGFLKQDLFLDNETDRRRFIATVGLPAGMIETLRNRMMDETGNIEYRYSNIVEIAIWQRDLMDEEKVFEPQRYLFDTSRFLIYGRPSGTAAREELIDDAWTSPDPQDFDVIKKNAIFRRYTPDGNFSTYEGSAYGSHFKSETHNVSTDSIFDNHLNDYYLKLFMRLTTGIDVSEDIFPFLEGNVFFDGPDPSKEELYEKLTQEAKGQFSNLQDIDSALNYDRLIGEIRRSLLLSSQKYRNRIIYPKVFERTFSMLIDPESFVEIDASPHAVFNPQTPVYSQYYATITLKPAFEDPNSEKIMYYTGTGARIPDMTLTDRLGTGITAYDFADLADIDFTRLAIINSNRDSGIT